MELISVVTPYNEEEDVKELYSHVKGISLDDLKGYSCEHNFIDNVSKDETVSILKEIARNDRNVKIIVNVI